MRSALMKYALTHNVIRLQVTVDDVQTVQVPQRSSKIIGNEKSLDPQLLLLLAFHVLELSDAANLSLGLLPHTKPR